MERTENPMGNISETLLDLFVDEMICLNKANGFMLLFPK